ncbi:hemolysin family protein [Methylobacterium sp. Leaf118]|uniref:hemolysin family protein n=1 Tax=Methylobacterium sp. Leaf118 TaxID=2876562 RepID=UPI001E4C258D|nr:hemolysin family protein [Methylobacterium sp. Leaf118]
MFELAVALFLILLNGAFSLSELAVVSARRARLSTLAKQGRRGARAALALADDPGRFLSAVQIGITLIGVLAGAYSGAALGQRMTELLQGQGVPERIAEPAGYGLVIFVITYLSVVIGELVPKNFALRDPEGIACLVAPSMTVVSRLAGPLVWLLDASTRMIFRLLGQTQEPPSSVTDEEIRTILAEAEAAGVIEGHEQQMIAGVLRLGDRRVRGVMTPRTEVTWLDLEDGEAKHREILLASPHARLPVADGGPENMVGVLQVRDLLPDLARGLPLNVRAQVKPAVILPDQLTALDALRELQKAAVPIALVHDEYGLFEGVLTPADILDAIAGAFQADTTDPDPELVRREDGSWLISGAMPVDEFAERVEMPLPERRAYETVAGLVLTALQRLPETGETVDIGAWRFEVVDMDGNRIDKVIGHRLQ